jgi:hypothetical protein
MRHFLVGATLLVMALAATFGLASILQGYATASRPQGAPVAGDTAQPPVSKPGDPAGRSPTINRVNFLR